MTRSAPRSRRPVRMPAAVAGAIGVGQAIIGDLPPHVPVPEPGRVNAIGVPAICARRRDQLPVLLGHPECRACCGRQLGAGFSCGKQAVLFCKNLKTGGFKVRSEHPPKWRQPSTRERCSFVQPVQGQAAFGGRVSSFEQSGRTNGEG